VSKGLRLCIETWIHLGEGSCIKGGKTGDWGVHSWEFLKYLGVKTRFEALEVRRERQVGLHRAAAVGSDGREQRRGEPQPGRRHILRVPWEIVGSEKEGKHAGKKPYSKTKARVESKSAGRDSDGEGFKFD